jgi:hypothetical protein
VWARQGLEHRTKRLRALEATVARESPRLTEAHRAALEKAKGEKEAPGECARACPGYCGAQATFSVGTLKGVGRISQQPFLDTSSQGAFAQRYARKTSLTAAALLNDHGGPCFDAHAVPLSRSRTERGTEDWGSPAPPESELYLAVETSDPTRTQGKSPQTKGSVERFPKTLRNEFSRLPCRKKLDTTLAALPTDLDGGRRESTEERGHHGRWW